MNYAYNDTYIDLHANSTSRKAILAKELQSMGLAEFDSHYHPASRDRGWCHEYAWFGLIRDPNAARPDFLAIHILRWICSQYDTSLIQDDGCEHEEIRFHGSAPELSLEEIAETFAVSTAEVADALQNLIRLGYVKADLQRNPVDGSYLDAVPVEPVIEQLDQREQLRRSK